MAEYVIFKLLPLKILSEANRRDHWATKARRAAAQRTAVGMLMVGLKPPTDAEFITIMLTRIAPRKLDSDNLAGGFKAVRDGVADWLGIDDGSSRLTWVYGQRTGTAGQYAAEVMVVWNDV